MLAVKAQIPAETLCRNLPNQTKIGPVEQIRELINVALPGIAIRALPVAPRQLPYYANTSYFELDRSSPYWAALARSGGVPIQVAGEADGTLSGRANADWNYKTDALPDNRRRRRNTVAEQIVSDLMMKFVGDEGPITGETKTSLNLRRTKMSMGFKEGKMFQIEPFTFKTGLGGEDLDELGEKSKKEQENQTAHINKQMQKVAAHTGLDLANLKNAGGSGFAKFRGGENALRTPLIFLPRAIAPIRAGSLPDPGISWMVLASCKKPCRNHATMDV